MASIVVTLRIMPEGPDTDLSVVETEARKHIIAFTGKSVFKSEQKPVAFGLKALEIMFVMDEAKGSTEAMEKKIAAGSGVSSVEVTDVRRVIG